ncbi:hypothetical protein ACFQ41_12405 [Lacticaseibacillus suilingensis]|uniref:Uncharacterized protein n=1 Tax=Lacticaseibacillus suilingensis TaxID=2799577 RepID=A0ABW4BJC2_9LACO|nr:hypothetical protein [Lacticaseibacillus suilingensis]
MSELRLNWEELHHLNPNLKGKVYQTGITRVADEASDVNLKARWMKIGEETIAANLKLYCLQNIHVSLEGYQAVKDASLEGIYAALYQRLITHVRGTNTANKSLRRERVDRVVGFLASEVDPLAVGQWLTPEILTSSVRQLLPADEALREYAKKNAGRLDRTVTPTPRGIHVRLEYRFKVAVGEGDTLGEAESIAKEKLADLLFDGDFPTVQDSYPQKSRQLHTPTSFMVSWARLFNISDDLTARILFFDAKNASMDNLIESIGESLCRIYCFANLSMNENEPSETIRDFIGKLAKLAAIHHAPYSLDQSRTKEIVIDRVIYRLFYYLKPLGKVADPQFEEILSSVSMKTVQAEPAVEVDKILPRPHADSVAASTQTRLVTSVYQTTVKHPAELKKQQPTVVPFVWTQMDDAMAIRQWLDRYQVPYTAILPQEKAPLPFLTQFLVKKPGLKLLVALSQLDREELHELAPLIQQVLDQSGGEVDLLAGNLDQVFTEANQVNGISASALLGLMNRGVKFGDLADDQVGGFIELREPELTIDLFLATPLSNKSSHGTVRLCQYTVSKTGIGPFTQLGVDFRTIRQPILRSRLEKIMFDDELTDLGF